MRTIFNTRGKMNIKMTILGICSFAAVFMTTETLYGQGNSIHSMQKLFRLSWTSSSLNMTCRVEWAAAPAGPWNTLQSTYVTSPSNQTDSVMASPTMFYRVVCEIPDPHLPDITVEQTLELINHRQSDPSFVIIDIRTLSEYNTRHIINALNYDYYQSSNFSAQLDALDKSKAYLIYCRSGSRSGYAHDIMRDKGFKEVYNMLGGMNAFDNVPGADNVLIP